MKKANYNSKNWFSLLKALTLVLIITAIGCKDGDDPQPTLEISKSSLSFLQTGGNETIEITTNQNWSFSTPPQWLTLSLGAGKNSASVNLTATANTEYSAREITLTLTAGSLTERILISQPGLDPVLTVTPKNVSFEIDGGTETVAVTANVTWTPKLPTGTDQWLSLKVAENKTSITITATPNTTAAQREATLTLSGDQEKSDVVTIVQDGPQGTTIAALRALSTDTKTDYTFITGLVTSDKEGKNLDDKEMIIQDAAGNAIALQFTEPHNITLGTQVDVLLNDGKKTIIDGLSAITNLKIANIASAETVTISAEPTVKTLAEILSNEIPDGLLVKIENVEFKNTKLNYSEQPVLWNGNEELPLYISAAAAFREQKVAALNGTIIGHIANNNGWKLLLRNTNDTKEMTNARLYDNAQLKLSATKHTFGNQGGHHVITVTTNDDISWMSTVSAGANWCTVAPSNGTGTGTFVVTAEAYTGESNRTATITVSAPDMNPVTVDITQMATAKREFVLSKWAESNLGAKLAATEENILGPDYKDTWGLYFQWGRNVGFPYTGAETTIATNENITAASAQEMTEFITSNGDWLMNAGNHSTWTDRAGSTPCPAGYRLPNKMDIIQTFPSSEDLGTFSNTQSKVLYERVVEGSGIPDRSLYVYDGTSKIYAIKRFETANAYILRWEILGEMGKNLYLKITEIWGDENSLFDNAEAAEALFDAATESEVRIFPVAGMLNFQDGVTLQAPGAAAWYWLDNRMRCIYILNTQKVHENGALCGYATPIRCIME